jgi:hypothetical protein
LQERSCYPGGLRSVEEIPDHRLHLSGIADRCRQLAASHPEIDLDRVGIYGHSTLLLIDALIKHNKDFDMLALANRNHGYSSDRLQDRGSTRLGGARPRDRQLTLESGIFRS